MPGAVSQGERGGDAAEHAGTALTRRSLRQQRHSLLVQFGISSRQQRFAVLPGRALPIADDAARPCLYLVVLFQGLEPESAFHGYGQLGLDHGVYVYLRVAHHGFDDIGPRK